MKAYPIVATEHLGVDTVNFLKGVAAGCAAVLVREPNNHYDANAIAVWIDDRKVGYVPKNQNKVLAQFIDQQGVGYDGEKLMAMDASPAARSTPSSPGPRTANSRWSRSDPRGNRRGKRR